MAASERWDDIWDQKGKFSSGRLGQAFVRDVIYRTVRDIVRLEMPDCAHKLILETGSGTGLVSLDLAAEGADVFLLDLSPQALKLSRGFFARENLKPAMVQASVLSLPFKDGIFDFTWSAGVIEHFTEDEQVVIVNEMLRVTRSNGRVLLIAPSSRASTYMKAKRYADARAMWQPGHETPLATFKHIAAKTNADIIKEYRTGRIAELHFLKYYFEWSRVLWLAWCGVVEILSRILSRFNHLPGYLLVAILKRKQ